MPEQFSDTNHLELATELTIAWLSNPNTRAAADDVPAFLQKMHDSPEWAAALEKYGWTDDFRTGADFDKFLDEQDTRVSDTLEGLGLL